MLFRNRVYWGKAGRIVPAILLVALSVTLMVGLVAAEVVDGALWDQPAHDLAAIRESRALLHDRRVARSRSK